jgi:hypothetical protein
MGAEPQTWLAVRAFHEAPQPPSPDGRRSGRGDLLASALHLRHRLDHLGELLGVRRYVPFGGGDLVQYAQEVLERSPARGRQVRGEDPPRLDLADAIQDLTELGRGR